MSIHRLAAVAVVLSVGFLSNQAAQAQSYTALDLGTLGGSTAVAAGLNNLGQVVGASTTASGSTHAFVTGANGLGLTDLGTLGGAASYAAAINDSGQVVGKSQRADGLMRAFTTGAGGVGMTDLGTLGGNSSAATGISNAGQIVGTADIPGGQTRAFSVKSSGAPMYSVGSFSAIRGSAPTSFSGARGVNDSGLVVGSAYESCNCALAAFTAQTDAAGIASSGFLHMSGLSGDASTASAVNAAGQIVGYANGFPAEVHFTNGAYRAFVTTATGVTDIGALLGGGSISSYAYAINNLGQVGGTFTVGGEFHGFITSANGLSPVDINSLVAPISGAYFTSVVGLNDLGQVLVTASNSRSYLLSAVPEAGTNVLMALGLGLMGLVVARRKAQAKAEAV